MRHQTDEIIRQVASSIGVGDLQRQVNEMASSFFDVFTTRVSVLECSGPKRAPTTQPSVREPPGSGAKERESDDMEHQSD